jgi:hypothetical protein
MEKYMSHNQLAEEKHELLDWLIAKGYTKPSGYLYHLRDLVDDPNIWASWKKENILVILWVGRMYYTRRKASFIRLDPRPNDGAATYVNP